MNRKSGLIQSSMLAVGNVAASGFSAISLIILSRYLGPAEFGGFSVAFSLTQLVARVLDFGFNISLQRYVAREHNHEVQASAAIWLVGNVKVIAAFLAVVIGLFAGPIVSDRLFHLNQPHLTTIGIVLAAIIILYEYVLAIIQSLAKFSVAIVMNASQAIVKCLAAIISLAAFTPNALIAYLWYGLAPLVAVVVGWGSIPKSLKKRVTQPGTLHEITNVMKFSAVGVLAAAVGDNIDVLMVNASLSEYQTGLYSAAARVAMMGTMFGISFGTVFNTRVAKYQNQKDLHSFFTKAIFFSLASIALIPFTWVIAKPLLVMTAGTQYLGAVTTMNYLMASALWMMAIMPFIAIFYVVDYPAYFAISGIIQTIVLITANAYMIPQMGIEGAGLAKLITRVIVALYTIYIAYKHAHRQYGVRIPTLKEIRRLIHG